METLFLSYSVEDRFAVVKNFPHEIFAKYEEGFPGRCDYSITYQTLIIKRLSLPHEEAASSFDIMMITIAKNMKVRGQLACRGATNADTATRTKQADRSWGPRRAPRGFPTVALEIGVLVSTAKLEKDIAWWINESNGEVRLGITIDIKSSGRIEIKSWIPASEPSSHPSYVTAGACNIIDRSTNDFPPPRVYQRVFFKRGKDDSNPTIEGEGLIIPFQDLLLEQPGQGEGDFVFPAQMLLDDVVERVWWAIDDAEEIKARKKNTYR
jgi:hypothetical protein